MLTGELEQILDNDNLSEKEKDTIKEAINQLNKLEHQKEEQEDSQGWPLKKLTVGDIRKYLRAHKIDNDILVRVLRDDGMGYGATNGYCSDVYVSKYGDEKELQIWF